MKGVTREIYSKLPIILHKKKFAITKHVINLPLIHWMLCKTLQSLLSKEEYRLVFIFQRIHLTFEIDFATQISRDNISKSIIFYIHLHNRTFNRAWSPLQIIESEFRSQIERLKFNSLMYPLNNNKKLLTNKILTE